MFKILIGILIATAYFRYDLVVDYLSKVNYEQKIGQAIDVTAKKVKKMAPAAKRLVKKLDDVNNLK